MANWYEFEFEGKTITSIVFYRVFCRDGAHGGVVNYMPPSYANPEFANKYYVSGNDELDAWRIADKWLRLNKPYSGEVSSIMVWEDKEQTDE